MKNSLAALLADEKARVVPRQERQGLPVRRWYFQVQYRTPELNAYIESNDTFPTRSEAELAGEALRDKAKEQVRR